MRILLTTAPRSVKGAWSVDGVRLSVCRLSRLCEACTKTTKPTNVTI